MLEAYGTRVQESVFECRIGERQFVELRQRMSQTGLAEGDLVRYYTLCRACQAKVEFTGGLPPQIVSQWVLILLRSKGLGRLLEPTLGRKLVMACPRGN